MPSWHQLIFREIFGRSCPPTPHTDDGEDGGVAGGDDDGVPVALPPHPTWPLPHVIYSGCAEEEAQEKPNIWLFPN